MSYAILIDNSNRSQRIVYDIRNIIQYNISILCQLNRTSKYCREMNRCKTIGNTISNNNLGLGIKFPTNQKLVIK